MKSKNVLIVIPHLGVGGTEIQTLNTVRALTLGGYKVTVLCLFRHIASVVADYENCGAKIYCACPQYNDYGIAIAYPKHLKLFLFLYKHLKEVIRKEKIDVVHVQYMSPASSVILVLRFLLFQRNIIVTSHTMADIYKNLSLVHFIQKHCARVFTCITERAEHSFFGTSQLYTPDTVLGRRNHFTIYNALSLRYSERLKAAEQRLIATASQVNVAEQRLKDTQSQGDDLPATPLRFTSSHPDGDSTHYTLHSKQEISYADYTESTEGKSLRPCCHPDGDSTHYTLHTKQEISHADCTESTEGKSLRPCCLPDGNTKPSTLNTKPYTKRTLGVGSRLEAIKGMDLVVPALAEVLKVHPSTQLLVVGDGSLRASMEQQAAELGCADHIRWVGRQPQEELPQWYSQMDIVLMPSRSEGFGLTAIEAMACGCVMVASDTGGLPEVVRDGVCGLLHRTEDVTDMAAKISILIGDQELYDRLRAQSLVEVEKYSFERYAALMNDLYNKLGK